MGENKVGELADFDWVRAGPSPNWRSAREGEDLPSQAQIHALGNDERVEGALKLLLAA